jgi:hypothetical protein
MGNIMTDKEKLKEIKKLADAMYYAAFNLTTDASLLKKAMNEYHQFVIFEYYKEEPVNSVWHDANEEPEENNEVVFQWCSEDSDNKWLDVGFYHKDGDYIKTIGEQGENEIERKFVLKWARSEDLLKL